MSLHKLKTNLNEIGDIVEADQDDLDFLKNFLNNPALKSILQVRICVLTWIKTQLYSNSQLDILDKCFGLGLANTLNLYISHRS